jgi:hypothetical protein
MNKKQWVMGLLAITLAIVYVIFFTDWFRTQTLHIYHTSRPSPKAMRKHADLPVPITFGFSQKARLTEVEVFQLEALQTNKNVLPLWHLVSDSNSVPIASFYYGQNIHGMKPSIKGVRAQPLAPDTTYRMLVSAGKIKGEHDFKTGHW